jgi:hypothetical protein
MPFDSAGFPNARLQDGHRPWRGQNGWVSEALVRGRLAALCLAFGLVMCRLAIGG